MQLTFLKMKQKNWKEDNRKDLVGIHHQVVLIMRIFKLAM